LLLIWRAEILPDAQAWWLLVPLLASAYGFSQTSVKTSDGYFLGFPSYWNVVAFYLYVLKLPSWLALTLILILSFLTFVPSRYLYPSQRGKLNRLTYVLGTLWVVFPVWILANPPNEQMSFGQAETGVTRQIVLVSLFFPLYYLFTSWILSLRYWLRSRPRSRAVSKICSKELS
jgi:phosphatidylcholine synthase